MAAKDYIRWIRSKVGHEKIILAFAGGCIFNDQGKVLLQRRGDSHKWGFPGGAIEPGEAPEIAFPWDKPCPILGNRAFARFVSCFSGGRKTKLKPSLKEADGNGSAEDWRIS